MFRRLGPWHVEFDDVSKSYGSVLAVDSLDLEVEKGELLTLVGPSGCGKTTALRMVAGFVSPTSGSIFIKGERINDRPPNLRNTAMFFQNYALFPHMNVFENVAFGLRMRRTQEQEIHRKVKEVLELVQLRQLEERYPRQLSGGQQQRIALARALVIEPDVLLLDEPLSNLDLKLRQAMRLELKSIQKRTGVTMIYVTHDQGEALTMSDKLAVINKGKLMQIGSPTEVYERPANEFVAQFLGDANILSGTIRSVNDGFAEVSIDNGLIIVSSHSSHRGEGMAVKVSIRPERIQISTRPVAAKNSFKGIIEDVIYAGSDVTYRILVGEQRLIVEDRIQGLPGLRHSGDEIFVAWDESNSVILSADGD